MLIRSSKSSLLVAILFLFTLLRQLSAADSQPLRVRLSSDPTTLDWNLASTPAETVILMNTMEGLVEFDSNMKIRPALAESWTLSPDHKKYTFKIRKNVFWTNGTVLNASDFVRSWRRLLAPSTAAPYAYFLFGIVGAEEFNSGKLTDFGKVGVRAKDPNTLEITLKSSIPYFLQLLTFWVTFPIQGEVADKTVVLGAYQIAEYRPGQKVILARNDGYYGTKAKIERIELSIVEDDSTAVKLFQSGKLDFTRPVAQLDLATYATTPSLKRDPYERICFLSFNTSRAPFDQIEARQAVRGAIDVADLASISHGTHKPAYTLIPENVLKLEAPRKMQTPSSSLRETPVTLTIYANDENAILAERFQAQIATKIGLKIKIRTMDYKSYQNALKTKNGDIFFRCWGADYVDADAYFSIFSSKANSGRMTWVSPEYDRLIESASTEISQSRRKTLYQSAQRILIDDSSAIIPLYFDSLTYLLAPAVKNFKINPLNYIYFKNVQK